jgi:hypothetical protein
MMSEVLSRGRRKLVSIRNILPALMLGFLKFNGPSAFII